MTNVTSPALPLTTGSWTLDRAHSNVGFAVRHLGVAKVRGRFDDFDASLVVGPSIADTAVSATVAVASINTGNADRDAHALSSDLLDVELRPTLVFRSTTVTREGDDWNLDGELTIGDVTRPVRFDVEYGGIEVFPVDGSRHAGFEASGEIRRSDFGIHFGPLNPALGDVIKIQLDFEFVEPA
jgi:polyisoprenoid-binding protein YceI